MTLSDGDSYSSWRAGYTVRTDANGYHRVYRYLIHASDRRISIHCIALPEGHNVLRQSNYDIDQIIEPAFRTRRISIYPYVYPGTERQLLTDVYLDRFVSYI